MPYPHPDLDLKHVSGHVTESSCNRGKLTRPKCIVMHCNVYDSSGEQIYGTVVWTNALITIQMDSLGNVCSLIGNMSQIAELAVFMILSHQSELI